MANAEMTNAEIKAARLNSLPALKDELISRGCEKAISDSGMPGILCLVEGKDEYDWDGEHEQWWWLDYIEGDGLHYSWVHLQELDSDDYDTIEGSLKESLDDFFRNTFKSREDSTFYKGVKS